LDKKKHKSRAYLSEFGAIFKIASRSFGDSKKKKVRPREKKIALAETFLPESGPSPDHSDIFGIKKCDQERKNRPSGKILPSLATLLNE
jgi:hypothetical protein